MKQTFLHQNRPFVTAMIQCPTPDEDRYAIKNAIYDGATAIGVQLEKIMPDLKTPQKLKAIFEAAGQRPIYVTNYRNANNTGLSDEDCMDGLLLAMQCGATLADIMGDTFDRGAPMELSYKADAVEKQKKLIDQLHGMGKEVLMSSHILKYTPAEQVLEVAFEQQRRGVDVVKIVTAGNSDEEQMENLRITTLLKKELSVPFMFLSGGTHSKIHRMVGPMLGCLTYLTVPQHDSNAIPSQPTVRAAKQVLDAFDYLPDIID